MVSPRSKFNWGGHTVLLRIGDASFVKTVLKKLALLSVVASGFLGGVVLSVI